MSGAMVYSQPSGAFHGSGTGSRAGGSDHLR